MSFSSGLRITDLNDFLVPEQDCIKPATVAKKSLATDTSETSIRIGSEGEYYESISSGNEKLLGEAQVNLADCLACSGCVTTAEAVLVSLQSHKQVIDHMMSSKNDPNSKKVIFTLSPQTRASLAIKYNKNPHEIAVCLTDTLLSNGASLVLDLNFARQFMQIEAAHEFIEYKRSKSDLAGPLVSSWCPGIVCYAEKSQHSLVPAFSKVKSPQQIMGSFVKSSLARKNNMSPSEIYHVAVMPCFDKKLEASRPEFVIHGSEDRTVDIVISTAELELLLDQLNINTLSKDFDSRLVSSTRLDETFSFEAANSHAHTKKQTLASYSSPSYTSSAGGTMEYVLSAAAHHLYGLDIPLNLFSESQPDNLAKNTNLQPDSSQLVQVCFPSRNRSKDYKEVTIKIPNSNKKIVGVSVYGFRHLQTLIRKLNTKAGKIYDYVEIAACPGACANGGGQIKPESTHSSTPANLKLSTLVESVYRGSETSKVPTVPITAIGQIHIPTKLLSIPGQKDSVYSDSKCSSQNQNVTDGYPLLLDIGDRGSKNYAEFMNTEFHVLEKQGSKLTTSW